MAIDTPKDSRGRDLPPLETKETDAQIRTRKRSAELKEKKRKADLKQKADKKKEAKKDIVKDISKLSDKKYYDDVPKKVDTKKEKKKVPSVSFGKAFRFFSSAANLRSLAAFVLSLSSVINGGNFLPKRSLGLLASFSLSAQGKASKRADGIAQRGRTRGRIV